MKPICKLPKPTATTVTWTLGQGSATLLCKRTDSEYFRLCQEAKRQEAKLRILCNYLYGQEKDKFPQVFY